MKANQITRATLGRLPLYLNYLKQIESSGTTSISATTIAKALSLGEVQVRKDLASVSGAGKPKVGYESSDLIKRLEDTLGSNSITSAVLVGAGKLGRALLDYNGFEEFGIKIIAAFDSNDEVIRFSKTSKDILPISTLSEYCIANNVKLGIITVGQGSAQQVCNMMEQSGIKAIWNFAPCNLEVSDGILVKNENLALSLAHLSNQLSK
jgi:redox-sensing transcriptional repressor